ncbi:MAG: aspartate aminotransferase family protein [Clostridia bacterium]
MSQNKAPNNNVFYRNQNWHYPKILRGQGIYLIADDGKKYIDGCSGSAVANIGHGNKEVAEYAKEQIEKIAFTHLSMWTVDVIEECATKIASWTPNGLNHVFFVSGGSEAVETAIKMARQYFVERDGSKSSKWKVISKWYSYHGATLGALSATGSIARRKVYDPMLTNFPKINQFYHYRNPWEAKNLYETSVLAAKELETGILRNGAENIAAFISEPIVGSAAPGVHPEKIYFKLVREICDKYDILFIMDEVMAGSGRSGSTMASSLFEAKPDIIAVAKGLSSGYTPIGAAVCSDEIFNTIMVNGSGHFIHGHTYASNPLSCTIALKVMEIIERENYIDNGAIQGEYLLNKMQSLYKYPIVGDVRGKGLLLGIEFVKNQTTKEPFNQSLKINSKINNACMGEGLVLYPGGGSANGAGDHVLIAPPINITRKEVDLLFEKLESGIKIVSNKLL